MRISDWSSDVCSTDLLTPLLGHWGMVLGAAPLGERAAQGFDVAGRRLRLFSAGRFETLPAACRAFAGGRIAPRSEEHTSELQSLMRISYAVFCLKKKKKK